MDNVLYGSVNKRYQLIRATSTHSTSARRLAEGECYHAINPARHEVIESGRDRCQTPRALDDWIHGEGKQDFSLSGRCVYERL